MNGIRLVAVLFRLSLLNELQYRVNFFVSVFQSAVALGTGLAVMALVYGNVSELNGWTRAELLVVLGVYTLIGGVIKAAIQPNMLRLMRDIQDGTLDFVLVKPVDAQLFVSTRELQLWQVVDIFAGSVVIAIGVAQLDSSITPARLVAFVAVLGFGVGMVYCVWLLMTTIAFRAVRMDQVAQVFEGVYQAGRWPVGVYPSGLRVGLTFLVPIAFAVTVPAEALTGRLEWTTFGGAAGLTIVLAVLTRWCFRRGVRQYSGASA